MCSGLLDSGEFVVGSPPPFPSVRVSHLFQHIRNFPVGKPQVALPLRVGGIGGGEPLRDGEGGAECAERAGQVPLSAQDITHALRRKQNHVVDGKRIIATDGKWQIEAVKGTASPS